MLPILAGIVIGALTEAHLRRIQPQATPYTIRPVLDDGHWRLTELVSQAVISQVARDLDLGTLVLSDAQRAGRHVWLLADLFDGRHAVFIAHQDAGSWTVDAAWQKSGLPIHTDHREVIATALGLPSFAAESSRELSDELSVVDDVRPPLMISEDVEQVHAPVPDLEKIYRIQPVE